MSNVENNTMILLGASVKEINAEAKRLGLSSSRVAQMAWNIARGRIMSMPRIGERYPRKNCGTAKVCFDAATLEEISAEAERLDISLSRVCQIAWDISMGVPASNFVEWPESKEGAPDGASGPRR